MENRATSDYNSHDPTLFPDVIKLHLCRIVLIWVQRRHIVCLTLQIHVLQRDNMK